jgi:hypothetical protein
MRDLHTRHEAFSLREHEEGMMTCGLKVIFLPSENLLSRRKHHATHKLSGLIDS